MPPLFKIRFQIQLDKKDKNGTYPIFALAYLNKKRFKLFTGERCKEEQWSVSRERFKTSFKGYREANNFLEELEQRILKAYRDVKSISDVVSVQEIKKRLKQQKAPEKTEIVEVFDEFIIWAEKNRAKNTIKGYKTVRMHLENYINKKRLYLTIEDFDFNNYLEFSELHGLKNNGKFSIDKNFRSFLNFVDLKQYKRKEELNEIIAKYVPTIKVFLTKEEIKKFESVELNKYERDSFRDKSGRLKKIPIDLEKARDCLIFMYNTGLAYTDAKKLTRENIIEQDGFYIASFLRTKTRNKNALMTEVFLPKIALDIIEKYKDEYAKALPMPSDQKLNEAIKIIARKAGIDRIVQLPNQDGIETKKKWELLTTHSARHTYATQSLMKGIKERIIAQNMGLSSIKHLDTYVKIIREYQHQETKRLWEEDTE